MLGRAGVLVGLKRTEETRALSAVRFFPLLVHLLRGLLLLSYSYAAKFGPIFERDSSRERGGGRGVGGRVSTGRVGGVEGGQCSFQVGLC